MDEPDSCGEDVAAYALGALEAHEAEAFERHLKTCAVCSVELRAFQQIVNEVAAGTPPVAARAKLRRRVMAAVREDAATAGHQREARPARRRRRGSLSLRGPAIGLGAGIAFAVAAIVVVVIALPGRQGDRTVQAVVDGRGTAALRITADHTELVVRNIASPPRGEVYEVWLKHGKASPRPTPALFSVDRNGDTSVDIPGSLYGVSQVMVTPEPSGGTEKPTHKPVITAAL